MHACLTPSLNHSCHGFLIIFYLQTTGLLAVNVLEIITRMIYDVARLVLACSTTTALMFRLITLKTQHKTHNRYKYSFILRLL